MTKRAPPSEEPKRERPRRRSVGDTDVIVPPPRTTKAGKSRGRPFARGADPRRNTKGRGRRRNQDDAVKELRESLMSPVFTVTGGRRRRVPMVRALADKFLAGGAQGDLAALRAASSLFRSVSQLYSQSGQRTSADGDGPETDHDIDALQRIIDAFAEDIAERTRNQTRNRRKGEK